MQLEMRSITWSQLIIAVASIVLPVQEGADLAVIRDIEEHVDYLNKIMSQAGF